MSKPPPSPPSSDIGGVNRDARVGTADKTNTDPGGEIDRADKESKGQPDQGKS